METSYAGNLEFSDMDSFFSSRASDSKLKDHREDKHSIISIFVQSQNNNDATIRYYFLKNLFHKSSHLSSFLEKRIEVVSFNFKSENDPDLTIETIRFNLKGLYRIKIASRDPIMIVRIVTATAWLSNSGRRNSSLRMTVLNRDWYEALR